MPIKLKHIGIQLFMLLLLAAFLYVFFSIVWFSGKEIDTYTALSANGKEVSATVTDTCRIVDDDDDRYEVYVSYSVDGNTYTDIYYDYVENPPSLGEQLALVVDPTAPTVFRKPLGDILPMTVIGLAFAIAVYGFFSFLLTQEVSAFVASKRRKNYYTSKHLTKEIIIRDICFEREIRVFWWNVLTWVLAGVCVIVGSTYAIFQRSFTVLLLYIPLFFIYLPIARTASRREKAQQTSFSIYSGKVKSVEIDSDLDGTVYRWEIGDVHTWVYDKNCIITFRNNNPYVFKQEKVYIAKNADGKVCRIFSQKEFTAEDIE